MGKAPRLWRISEVAKRYGVHPQTLRGYEREGLLQPSRSRGNARGYTASDLERLECILSLTRELGVNLAGVEVILHMREQMHDLQEEVRHLTGLLAEQLRCEGAGTAPVALVPLRPRTVVRTRGGER